MWIELTRTDNSPVLINTDLIVFIRADADLTLLGVNELGSIHVVESYEVVREKLAVMLKISFA